MHILTFSFLSLKKEPSNMFNMIYDFLQSLSSAKMERNQVDICHKTSSDEENKEEPKEK